MSVHLFISIVSPPLTLSTIYLSLQSFFVISCYFPELPLEPSCSQTNPGVIELAYRERCCVMFQLPCDEPKGANIDRQFSLSLPSSLPPLSRFSYYSQTRQIRVTRDENGTKWNIFPSLFSPPHSFLSSCRSLYSALSSRWECSRLSTKANNH